jgi:hypothetical protein
MVTMVSGALDWLYPFSILFLDLLTLITVWSHFMREPIATTP